MNSSSWSVFAVDFDQNFSKKLSQAIISSNLGNRQQRHFSVDLRKADHCSLFHSEVISVLLEALKSAN